MSANYSRFNSIRDQKKQLRADYLAKRRAISPEERAFCSGRICNAFLNLVSYRYANVVLLYYPRPDEVDTRPLLARALADGKAVALPRCEAGKEGRMDFYFIQSEADLSPGAFGIPEPSPHLPRFDPATHTSGVLMTLPGIAFDRSGYRLGYGKGYYDRYLENRTITTAGLVYADFVTDVLPRGRYDLPAHFIVTEKGVTLVE